MAFKNQLDGRKFTNVVDEVGVVTLGNPFHDHMCMSLNNEFAQPLHVI
jgi:hypothetical protein